MISRRKIVVLFWILVTIALAFVALAASWYAAASDPDRSQAGTVIQVPALREASGLAVSHRVPDLLWSHNDSGGQPVLYAFGVDGQLRGTVRVAGVRNNDWEAIASFELDGKPYIAIGEIGNNSGQRKNTTVLVIEEPPGDQLSPSVETPVPVAWSVPFRFESGPHDCETLLVDPRLRLFYLVTKRTAPPELCSLPIQVPPGKPAPLTAAKVGVVAHLPRPSRLQRLFPTAGGRYRAQPTDGCIAPDGRSAAILTYGAIFLYRRNPGQTWELAFQHEPVRIGAPGLPQAEGLCFSADGKSLFVTGEQRNPVLLRYEIP